MKKSISFLAAGLCMVGVSGSTAFAQDKAAAKAVPSDFDKAMEAFLAKDDNVAKIGDALERYIRIKQQREEQQRLEESFKNPVAIEVGPSPVKGPVSAPVTIVEFSDFECPYCGRGAQIMEEVLKRNPEKVRLVFKNLPLPFHENARPAALAALAAGEQGKFWEMHDKLFSNQRDLTEAKFTEIAKDLGLDLEKFKADLTSPKLAKIVDDDLELAKKLGVQGTPGFFVNGVQVRGAQPPDQFQKIIDRWIEKEAK